MRKFFCFDGIDDVLTLTGTEARHIKTVLRLKIGDAVVICDGAGKDYNAVIREFTDDGVVLEIGAVIQGNREPKLMTNLYLAYTKAERLDFAVQKAVELGAAHIRLFSSERCVAEHSDKRVERLERIALEAAKQSGRSVLTDIKYVGGISNALLYDRNPGVLKLFCYELETAPIRGEFVDLGGEVSIMCGPEGGFSEKEAVFASKTGWRSVSLGKRVLRAETAPIAALSVVLYAAGDI
ncbi:ribosomal RNA small subunit methyltransferase E [Clostridia bacterium]|nr:ribosomal RNA small subunit methyltransferase E [Clostridia bacterium]